MRATTIVVLLAGLCACGSDDASSGGGFGTCDLSGSPFGHEGTATIRGTGTLPPLEKGLSLQLLLEAPVGFKVGVLAQNLFTFQKTCDAEFPFEVTKVEAGTYTVWVEARDTELADAMNDEDLVYEADADKEVTVTDGQVLDIDLDFRM